MKLSERIRFLFRLFLLLTFLAAIAAISAVATIKLTIQGNQETLPSLVGVSLPKANRIAGSMGLVVKVEDKLFSHRYAATEIISQQPPPHTVVKEGQHVHVLVSLGAPRIVVPDLVGSSVRVAQILAVGRGLAVGDLAQVYWPGTQTGEVVAQDPLPSSSSIKRPSVDLLVSLGKRNPAYVCPDFAGMRLQLAMPAIQAAGFSIAKVTPVADAQAANGTILSQSPAAGTKISAGDSFSFQVAQQG